uniref:Uncharacterized protein MANES_08G098100 n=1 Tax=Rhizophora mucronata TaxID=61149 RepID=A0A2P2LMR3_RHIMU
MGRGSSLAALIAFILAATAIRNCEGEGEGANKTSSPAGLFWSTAKDEADLSRKNEPDDDYSADVIVNDPDEADGGFSSLDGMLQWAIGHSDPAKLKETAKDVQRLSPSELKQRQLEIKELMDTLKMPSDAQLMQIAIDDLNNLSLSLEDRHRALRELLVLVEPVDNANDLSKLGGLSALIRELNHSDPDVRTMSAWVLGKASQNHAILQKQVQYILKNAQECTFHCEFHHV